MVQDKAAADNKANQGNPNNPTYDAGRGGGSLPAGQADDNRANQMNSNNPTYDSSRSGSGGKK